MAVWKCQRKIKLSLSRPKKFFFWDKYNEWETSCQSSIVMWTTNSKIFWFHHPRVSLSVHCQPKSQRTLGTRLCTYFTADGTPNITEIFLSTVKEDSLLQISIIFPQCPVKQSMLSSLLLSTICYTVNDFRHKHCIVYEGLVKQFSILKTAQISLIV